MLRALTHMEQDADETLSRFGVSVENVPSLAEHIPLNDARVTASPDAVPVEVEPIPQVEARHSIALLQDSLTTYFQSYTASVRAAMLDKMRVATSTANEETLARNVDTLIHTTCRRMAERTYADFRTVVLAEAAHYDLADDAEAYFTWRIEKSDTPLPLTMTQYDAGAHMTAEKFYTPELVAQFRAWERENTA